MAMLMPTMAMADERQTADAQATTATAVSTPWQAKRDR